MAKKILSRIAALFRNPKSLDDAERARWAEERLDSVIDEVEAEGLIDEEAQEMIRGVIDFSNAMVREVMVPRTEIVAVDIRDPIEKVIETILESGHSRIPVFEENIDHIKGLVHAKDLLRHWGANRLELAPVMREPYFIPETKGLDDLLSEFRRQRIQMAIVIDEYGGTSGLVTIEDLIEEIVGEIIDEYDDDEALLHVIHPDEVVVSARLEIDDLFEHFGLDKPQGKFSTVGGWIFHHTGYIPQQDETFHLDGFDVTIETRDEKTIKRVKVVRPKIPETID